MVQPIRLNENYYVSPQIELEDIKKLADQGFSKIICNRPDDEIPTELHSEYMAIAAKEAGIEFDVLPLTHQTMTPENIAKQGDLIDRATGPIPACCAEQDALWFGHFGSRKRSADDIIQTAKQLQY